MTKNSQTVIITGATGAIGKAIALQIAAQGYQVVIIARNEDKAQHAVHQIIQTTTNPQVCYKITDLSRRAEIQKLARDSKDDE